jgi:hypothetical protein
MFHSHVPNEPDDVVAAQPDDAHCLTVTLLPGEYNCTIVHQRGDPNQTYSGKGVFHKADGDFRGAIDPNEAGRYFGYVMYGDDQDPETYNVEIRSVVISPIDGVTLDCILRE